MLFSALPQTAFAAENSELPFTCQVYSEKQSYEKGEEIKVTAAVTNNSLNEYNDMRIWLDYPKTEYYLTPGATERFVESFNIIKVGISVCWKMKEYWISPRSLMA